MAKKKAEENQGNKADIGLTHDPADEVTLAAASSQAFVARLRMAFDGGGPYVWAKKTGASPSTVKKWLSGESEPGRGNLVAISYATGYTVEWLTTGRGDKYTDIDRNPKAPGTVQRQKFVAIDRDLLIKSFEAAREMIKRGNELRTARGQAPIEESLESMARLAGGIYEESYNMWVSEQSKAPGDNIDGEVALFLERAAGK